MKPIRTLLLGILCSTILTAYSASHHESLPKTTIVDQVTTGYRMVIESKVFNQDRTVLISLPPDYSEAQRHYPVIYFTDASPVRLRLLRGVVDFLADIDQMPQSILVGIVQVDRGKELAQISSPGEPDSSGASRTILFLKNEVIPLAEARYRTLPSRIYIGHSFGGIFGLYCILQAPDLFNAQIAADPSLWKQSSIVDVLPELIKAGRTGISHLYITQTDGMSDGELFAKLNKNMESQKNASFRYDFHKMPPSVGHDLSLLPSISAGLIKLFQDYAPPADSDMSFDEFKAHFSKPVLGAIYTPTVGKVREFALNKFHLKKHGEAIKAYQFVLTLNPDSLPAYERLCDLSMRVGNMQQALEYADRAIAIAKRTGSPDLDRYVSNRQDVLKKMNEKPTINQNP